MMPQRPYSGGRRRKIKLKTMYLICDITVTGAVSRIAVDFIGIIMYWDLNLQAQLQV